MGRCAAECRPIGIFDSGVGGLTVSGRLAETLPAESLLYLGDTARVPYGSKSKATVVRYARSCAKILVDRHIKLLVVACNTASAFALDILTEELDIPVVGVVAPGARAACLGSKTGRIAVIGTRGVIDSGAYPDMIRRIRPDAWVYGISCPLFVPFAEEGWTRGEAIEHVARHYLGDILIHNIDTLVLGCTHYPLLREVIQKTVGNTVRLVDSAEETAKAVAETLHQHNALCQDHQKGTHHFLVSDAPDAFIRTGEYFLGHPLDHVEWVDVC